MALQKVKNIVKLSLDEFSFEEFKLIAIQTPLEDYKVAYTLNKILDMRFIKEPVEIEFTNENGTGYFSHYTFEDSKHDLIWSLVQNKSFIQNQNPQEASLFTEIDHKFNSQINLIPELNKFDYLLKIDEIDDYYNIDLFITNLTNLKHISTVYLADTDQIKSINNLIF
jgi:hypothetical protein